MEEQRRNRARCALCNEIIESKNRHDFVFCRCRAIFVDGGNDYCRMGGNFENIIIVYDDDSEKSLLEVNQGGREKEEKKEKNWINQKIVERLLKLVRLEN